MPGRRILLFHITTSSGHHHASRAIEETLRALDPSTVIVSLDAFRYTSRFVQWAISRTYLSLIKHQPDVWEYLYDNPSVHRRIQYFRGLLHRYQAAKLARLFDTVRPDAIACTQAYPCGMVADFKKRHHIPVPLVGILTDHAPHLYWFHDTVDVYVVPSEQVKRRFVMRGVDPARVRVLGIPIDPTFARPIDQDGRAAAARRLGLSLQEPVILIMGGGGGFGQLRDIVLNLDTLHVPCQIVVLAGTNRALLGWLQAQRFRHRMVPLAYTEAVPELMELATLLVSKPGGLTISEAMAKHLPLVIVNPIPGQEAYNARFLISQGAAVMAEAPDTVRQTVSDLLENPEQLRRLRERNAELAHPRAAPDIAALLLDLAAAPRTRAQPASRVPASAA